MQEQRKPFQNNLGIESGARSLLWRCFCGFYVQVSLLGVVAGPSVVWSGHDLGSDRTCLAWRVEQG